MLTLLDWYKCRSELFSLLCFKELSLSRLVFNLWALSPEFFQPVISTDETAQRIDEICKRSCSTEASPWNNASVRDWQPKETRPDSCSLVILGWMPWPPHWRIKRELFSPKPANSDSLVPGRSHRLRKMLRSVSTSSYFPVHPIKAVGKTSFLLYNANSQIYFSSIMELTICDGALEIECRMHIALHFTKRKITATTGVSVALYLLIAGIYWRILDLR